MISVITPSKGRESDLLKLISYFTAQTYPAKELLIADDDYSHSVADAVAAADFGTDIRYFEKRGSIGEKRNFLIEHAAGDVIAHFDDDDYYVPGYLQAMSAALVEREVDFVKLDKWFTYQDSTRTLAYLDGEKAGAHFALPSSVPETSYDARPWSSEIQNAMRWGYGFSYVYKRALAVTVPFAEMNHGEDYDWFSRVDAAGHNVACLADTTGLVLHRVHGGNTSIVFPQHLLPTFMLKTFFPGFQP